MADVVTGTIERVFSREQTGKHGPYQRVGFLVNGTWFNLNARKATELKAGDQVRIAFETNDKGDNSIIKDGISLVKAKSTEAPSVSVPKPTTTVHQPQSDTRQESIVFQNALSHAVEILKHNSKRDPGTGVHIAIQLPDVLKLAHEIAQVSINPTAHFKAKSVVKTSKKAVAKAVNRPELDLEDDDPFSD